MNFPWRAEEKGNTQKTLLQGHGPASPADAQWARERLGPGSPGAPGGCWSPLVLGAFPSPPPATPLEFKNMEFPQELYQAELAALPGSCSDIRCGLPAPPPRRVLTRRPSSTKLIGRVQSPRRHRASGAQRPCSGPAPMIAPSVGPLAEPIRRASVLAPGLGL
ncbi:hypothetical protein NN561_012092 [Cricetulus griseus]